MDRIDDQAELTIVGLKHDDVDFTRRVFGGVDAELLVEVNDRHQVSAQSINGKTVNLLDAVLDLIAFEPKQFDQIHLRYRVPVAAAGDRQCWDDRECQRDFEFDLRAVTEAAIDFDRAADFFDVRANDIHADAAAREVRHFVGRGKTGQEHEVDEFAVGHARRFFDRDELRGNRLATHPLRIDAASIVDNFDDDFAALVEGVQVQLPFGWFAVSRANVRFFDAVIDGVANHMRQRVADGFDDGFVEFGLLAFRFVTDFFAASEGHIANDARELTPDVSDRLHPRLHDVDLQLGR